MTQSREIEKDFLLPSFFFFFPHYHRGKKRGAIRFNRSGREHLMEFIYCLRWTPEEHVNSRISKRTGYRFPDATRVSCAPLGTTPTEILDQRVMDEPCKPLGRGNKISNFTSLCTMNNTYLLPIQPAG